MARGLKVEYGKYVKNACRGLFWSGLEKSFVRRSAVVTLVSFCFGRGYPIISRLQIPNEAMTTAPPCEAQHSHLAPRFPPDRDSRTSLGATTVRPAYLVHETTYITS